MRVRSESSIDRIHIIIHGACLFFTFLAICITGGVAGFQAKWVGVSGGTAFTIFLCLLSFILSCTLIIIPIAYDRWDKARRPAQFLSQPRSAFILNIFGSLLMFTAAIIATAASFGMKGCKNPENDPHAEDGGDDYVAALPGFCRTRKASAIFEWLAVICWFALAGLAGWAFRNERQLARRREPAFVPPTDDAAWGADADEDVFGDKHESAGLTSSQREAAQESARREEEALAPRPINHNYARVNANSAMARPSVDAYGAFDGDMPGSERREQPSRTMQMAYADPYAQIRQSVLNDSLPYQQPAPLPHHSPLPYHAVPAPAPAPIPAPYGQPPSYSGYH